MAPNKSQFEMLTGMLHCPRVSSPEKRGQVPNFALHGQPSLPQVLSNKIILTPITPGNVRGAVWADKPLQPAVWTADVDFRATGPERSGGNMNIWLAKNGNKEVMSSSIYTVGKFDGLALVIDTHDGSAGMIRGFLNDGSVDYKTHHNVDELAFGHCNYAYRNRGSPSQIKIRQSADIFRVEIDSQLCFESSKISIPQNYNLGITAATPDNPDSFEVYKLIVMEETAGMRRTTANNQDNDAQKQQSSTGNRKNPRRNLFQNSDASYIEDELDGDIQDESPDMFTTSEAQFEDLHRRLQSTHHQLSAMQRASVTNEKGQKDRHADLKSIVVEMKAELAKMREDRSLLERVKELEKEVRAMRNDIGKKMTSSDRSFKEYLTDHHASLSQAMTDSAPGHSKLIFVIIGSQVMLAAGYFLYKRRKASIPKKYL